MPEVKKKQEVGHTVRGVSPASWRWIKAQSALKGIKPGEYLETIIKALREGQE